MAKLMPVAFQLKKTYHSLLAVRPSKKARCPPLGVVANTMFLFALDPLSASSIHGNKNARNIEISSDVYLHSSQGMASLVQSGSSKALIQSKGTDTLPI